MSETAVTPQPPRLVGLFRDFYDDDGNAVGWTVTGWGLVFFDRSAVTVSLDGKSATLWASLEHALRELDAEVCDIHPRPFPQWWRRDGEQHVH